MAKLRESKALPMGRTGRARAVKQARASETVQRILSAANHLLNTNGHLSNEAIAEEADVSISSIYRYFRNREELFAEVFWMDASQMFETIAEKIGAIGKHHHRAHLEEIIQISVNSVSGDRTARARSYGKISFDAANEINITFNHRLKNKLTEQVALISNCHPKYVDESLVLILSRLLVSTPRLMILEESERLEHTQVLQALADTSQGILSSLIERAERTHSKLTSS